MNLIPTYKNIKDLYPISTSCDCFLKETRQTIRNILAGRDPRLLLIVGPCSIHDKSSTLEYAELFQKLAKKVSSELFLVMRGYCEKPRTSFGWKGFLYDPDLDGSNDISKGVAWSRKLLLDLLELGVPIATEFLDPLTAYYFEDLISWGSIGARTAASQPHRQLASALEMPIGFKNCLSGNISTAIHGILSAAEPHAFIGLNADGQASIARSKGNPDTHLVLRGGHQSPNYHPASVAAALKELKEHHLSESIIIDCSHHNSLKKFELQPIVFQSVLNQILDGCHGIKGMMVESHLFSGSQQLLDPLNKLKYGVSITDPCLDWNTTSQLIEWAAFQLSLSPKKRLKSIQQPCSFEHQLHHS